MVFVGDTGWSPPQKLNDGFATASQRVPASVVDLVDRKVGEECCVLENQLKFISRNREGIGYLRRVNLAPVALVVAPLGQSFLSSRDLRAFGEQRSNRRQG